MLAWPMPAGELGGNWVYADVASMPAVRRAASPYVRRSRDVSALRELRSGGQARRGRSFLSTARSPVRHLLAGAASRLCIRRAYLLQLRLLFFVLRPRYPIGPAVRHGRPEPSQAGETPPRHAYPDLRYGSSGRDKT